MNKIEELVRKFKQEKEILMFSTFFEGQHLHKENFDEHFHDTITKQYFDAKKTMIFK